MPSQISHHEYAEAVLNSIESGAFPESEEVISGNNSPSALPTVLNLIDEARDDVKVSRPLLEPPNFFNSLWRYREVSDRSAKIPLPMSTDGLHTLSNSGMTSMRSRNLARRL